MSKVKIQGNASGTGVLTVTAPNTSTDRTITLPDSTGTLVDSTTAVTKDANGNVGIGVTPETDWNSSFRAVQLGDGASIYGGVGWRETQISTNARATLGSALNGYKYIATDKASTYQQYDGNHNFRVAASGSADAAITWTTGFEVLNDGKARAANGLLFGTDTAASNALDDYEEGTWTPALTATTTAPSGMTYGFRSGDYTKIGDMVICRFGIKMNNIGSSGAGSVTIAGLPFTSISYGAYQEPNFSVNSGNNSTAMTHVRFFVQGGSTTCQGRRADTNADTTLVWSDLSNTSYFITCEIKYKTAS